jgi:hypothetical protein
VRRPSDEKTPGRLRGRTLADRFQTAMQVLAGLCLLGYFALLAHKASADITALAVQYSGREFWIALGRHLIRNLGGG